MSARKISQQHRAAGGSSTASIDAELSSLAELSIRNLKKAWTERLGFDPPRLRSRHLLLRLLAWQLQALALGGLDAITERKLRDIAAALERDGTYEPKTRLDLSPGIVLTREWKGVIHKVTVGTNGFQHLGKRYGSLSDIARTITGTRWSGPRFFGLEKKKAKISAQAVS
jgi:hypothetical protein